MLKQDLLDLVGLLMTLPRSLTLSFSEATISAQSTEVISCLLGESITILRTHEHADTEISSIISKESVFRTPLC